MNNSKAIDALKKKIACERKFHSEQKEREVLCDWMDYDPDDYADDCIHANCFRCGYYVSGEDVRGAIKIALAALEQQERNRWVPCSERLPEVGQRVLVEFNDGSMSVLRCNDAGHLQCFYARTVAWRPAPERYHEEEV